MLHETIQCLPDDRWHCQAFFAKQDRLARLERHENEHDKAPDPVEKEQQPRKDPFVMASCVFTLTVVRQERSPQPEGMVKRTGLNGKDAFHTDPAVGGEHFG